MIIATRFAETEAGGREGVLPAGAGESSAMVVEW
jgi:hypothetical protein